MAENEGDVLLNTEISDPVPGEHAFHGDGNVLAIGINDVEKGSWISFDVLMDHDFAFGVQDAYVHVLCMKVDSAVILVLLGVKFHRASSFW
jgi:hypothetical protein